MAAGNGGEDVREILILSGQSVTEAEKKFGHYIKSFTNLTALNKYVCHYTKNTDNFHLHIADLHLKELRNERLHDLASVRRINVYIDSGDALQSGLEGVDKLKFYHRRDLQNELLKAVSERASSQSGSSGQATLDSIIKLKFESLAGKRKSAFNPYSPVSKRCTTTMQDNSFIENINPRFFCPSCNTSFQEPNISCAMCSKVISNNEGWFAQGFEDVRQLSLTTDLNEERTRSADMYSEHISHNHHQFDICRICNERVRRSDFPQHYLNESHQRNVSALCSRRYINTDQIQDAMIILSNDIKGLDDYIQRMSKELDSYKYYISIMAEQLSSLKIFAREMNDLIYEMTINQNLLYQELSSLKERVEDTLTTSFDGTLTWKITSFTEKRMDARSERQNSIYSPAFYSSPTGYKMCLRLFLNGDSGTRGTNMSLFLVIMRGDYDAIVFWPFKFKVTFTLLNQLLPEKNQSVSFWCNIRSRSFQRPIMNMNIPYGVSKFFLLDILKNNPNQFVQDDIMYIKVEVDFLATEPEIPLNDDANELLNDEVHVGTTNDNLSSMICGLDTFY